MRLRAICLLSAAVVLAGCGPPAGTLFHVTLTDAAGDYALPVTLGDTTELVVSMEAAPVDAVGQTPSVIADPTNARALIVSWLGGMCEDEAVIGFWPYDVGYGMYVASRGGPGLFGGCPGGAVVRSVRIMLSSPVPAADVAFTSTY